MSKETHEFKTEVKQLLDLVIHSLYSNKEIFLRELISNASDAIDKARFESLTDKGIVSEDLKIKLVADKEAKTLTIIDNGIGMTREEVEANIGTIARSGTKAFMEAVKEGKDTSSPEMIGQFGVGFYSAFMVSDRVCLKTRKAGVATDQSVIWESAGDGAYTVDNCEKEAQGTEITVHLNDEFEEFLDEWRIRKVVSKFSDYIEYPVVMDVSREEGEDDEKVTTIEEETLNSMKAIWSRNKSEVTEEEYAEFYKHISHDFMAPQKSIHWNVEGTTEFKALVYIPSMTPMDFATTGGDKHGLHLYVKRVFITDSCKELLPDYLRFIRGVVDSSDLPLNVSREILQEDRLIKLIEKSVVKKVLDTLKSMKNKDPEAYLKFWNNFGKILKEGIHFDFANKEKIQDLVLFASSATEKDKLVSLKEYVERMPEGQGEIYYITGANQEMAANSPHLEVFKKKGYEVLYMIDPIDEWVVQAMPEYDGKKLKSVTKGDVTLESSEEEKKEAEEVQKKADEKYQTLLGVIGKSLEEDVREVRLSNRLTDSACCLVADEHGMDANMERIMKAMNQDVPKTKRVLELNPTHQILEVMNAICEKDLKSAKIGEYANLLYDQALLAEGSNVRNPLDFARRVSQLMVAEGKQC